MIVENSQGCKDTLQRVVQIFDAPQAGLRIVPEEGCEPLQVTLYNESNQAVFFEWQVESIGTFNFEDSITLTFTNPGKYNIQLIAFNNDTCRDTIVIPDAITVHDRPFANFTHEKDLYEEILGEVEFTNLSLKADDFQWNLGDGTISNEFEPYHEYDTNRFVQVLLVAYNYNDGAFTCIDSTIQLIDPGLTKTFFAPTAMSPGFGPESVQVFRPVE